MCGNLKAVMDVIGPEEFEKMPGVYRIFQATGKDLEKMSDKLKAQSKEIESVKEEVTAVKKDVSVVHAKVDTLTTVVVEIEKLIKEHFDPEHIKETVVGHGIIQGFKSKKFWITLLFMVLIVLFAGIGLYNLILTNPQIAKDIVSAAATIS